MRIISWNSILMNPLLRFYIHPDEVWLLSHNTNTLHNHFRKNSLQKMFETSIVGWFFEVEVVISREAEPQISSERLWKNLEQRLEEIDAVITKTRAARRSKRLTV
jgi:hypothetical protein